jgi:hypothetical protein
MATGCGGSDEQPGSEPTAQVGDLAALNRGSLERQLGNAFEAGLYRLAVMSQPGDDATDLGQDLPTGVVTGVSCSGSPDDGSERCRVDWRAVGGARRSTRYAVRILGGGCFAAGARPQLPDRRDATIASFSENPLNALVSTEQGCS